MLLIIIIISLLIALCAILIITSTKHVESEKPKFQPRQLTVIGKEVFEDVAPKRKYKKRKSKKKPVVEIEKRPVGRPKISK